MGPANDAGNSPRATPPSRRDCVSQAGPKEVAIDIASQTRYTIHNR
jgi:hypothetical protein